MGGRKKKIVFVLFFFTSPLSSLDLALPLSLSCFLTSRSFFLSLVRYIDQHVDCIINNLLFSRLQTVISTNEPAQLSHCSFCVCVGLYESQREKLKFEC